MYSGEDWRISFHPIAKRPASGGLPGIRPVGILSPRAKWVNTREAIKAEVTGKATRYGALDRSYLIALNVTSEWGCDDDDVVEALFGTVSERFRSTNQGIEHVGSSRNPDGAWHGPQGPRNTRNSGVLLLNGAMPWNVAAVPIRLFHNPYARLPWTPASVCRVPRFGMGF